jgi:hypothetical protein
MFMATTGKGVQRSRGQHRQLGLMAKQSNPSTFFDRQQLIH